MVIMVYWNQRKPFDFQSICSFFITPHFFFFFHPAITAGTFDGLWWRAKWPKPIEPTKGAVIRAKLVLGKQNWPNQFNSPQWARSNWEFFYFSSSFLTCAVLVVKLQSCWDQNSLKSSVRLCRSQWTCQPIQAYLKLTSKPQLQLSFPWLNAQVKKFLTASVAVKSPLSPQCPAQIVGQTVAGKCHWRTRLCCLSVPCPRHPDLPRSALASPNCSPKLLHHFQSCRWTRGVFPATNPVGSYVPP